MNFYSGYRDTFQSIMDGITVVCEGPGINDNPVHFLKMRCLDVVDNRAFVIALEKADFMSIFHGIGHYFLINIVKRLVSVDFWFTNAQKI